MVWDRGERSQRAKRIRNELGPWAFGFAFPMAANGAAQMLKVSEETQELVNYITLGAIVVLVAALVYTQWARQQNIKRGRG